MFKRVTATNKTRDAVGRRFNTVYHSEGLLSQQNSLQVGPEGLEGIKPRVALRHQGATADPEAFVAPSQFGSGAPSRCLAPVPGTRWAVDWMPSGYHAIVFLS